jgi:hypothetical protein
MNAPKRDLSMSVPLSVNGTQTGRLNASQPHESARPQSTPRLSVSIGSGEIKYNGRTFDIGAISYEHDGAYGWEISVFEYINENEVHYYANDMHSFNGALYKLFQQFDED